jgi:hypothetical protein
MYENEMGVENTQRPKLILPSMPDLIQNWCGMAAYSVLPVMRRRIGFRMLGLLSIVAHTLFMLILAYGASFFGVATSSLRQVSVWQAITLWPLMYACVFLYFAITQRKARWQEILDGDLWFSHSRGKSWLRTVLPSSLLKADYPERFGDPLLLTAFAIGMIFFSKLLALWFFYCALCLFAFEQISANKRLHQMLDTMDNMLLGEAHMEEVRFLRNQRSVHSAMVMANAAEARGFTPASPEVDELRQIIDRRKQREAEAQQQQPSPEQPEAAA